MILSKMKEKNNSLIVKKIENFLSKKNRRLHDPSFFGNEINYLKDCINTSFVSSVVNIKLYV